MDFRISTQNNKLIRVELYTPYTDLCNIVLDPISDSDNEYVKDYVISHVKSYNWDLILKSIFLSDDKKQDLFDDLDELFKYEHPFDLIVNYTRYDVGLGKIYMTDNGLKTINNAIAKYTN